MFRRWGEGAPKNDLPSIGYEDLLQLHDGGIGAQPLVDGVVLPRMTCIEMLCVGVMVAHDVERKRIAGSIGPRQAIDYPAKLQKALLLNGSTLRGQ